MTDFIRLEAAYKTLTEYYHHSSDVQHTVLREALNRVPTADVRPVVKAHWIYHEDDCGDYYECSHCHDEYVVYEDDMCWKHCPTCGAEMEPDEDGQRGENDNG